MCRGLDDVESSQLNYFSDPESTFSGQMVYELLLKQSLAPAIVWTDTRPILLLATPRLELLLAFWFILWILPQIQMTHML